MTQPMTPGTPDYTIGFSDEQVEHLIQRNTVKSAAYLLPHLKPGQQVLDFGCGPGSISVGLAPAVAPGGELHCVDMAQSQVELARALADSQGLDNLSCYVADVTNLPFEDGYFDVAHGHDILAHVPDTRARPGRGEAGVETGRTHRLPGVNLRVVLRVPRFRNPAEVVGHIGRHHRH